MKTSTGLLRCCLIASMVVLCTGRVTTAQDDTRTSDTHQATDTLGQYLKLPSKSAARKQPEPQIQKREPEGPPQPAYRPAPVARPTPTARLISMQNETPAMTQEKEPPFSYGISYSLYSDYIFRGINFSEYGREGREKPNHQFSFDLGVDLGAFLGHEPGSMGSLDFNAWLEYFSAQKQIDPENGGHNLQEVDYVISWSKDVEKINSSITLGFVFYTFPNAKALNTQELTFSIEHNDAWMWKKYWPENEDGVFNPTFFYGLDVDAISGGSWMELGISHGFDVRENLTVTPGFTLAIDHRYLDPILGTGRSGSTRFAYMQYSVTADYALSTALKWPESKGEVTLSGFLYFNDALGNAEDNRTIQDEFFGGMSLGWSF